MSAEDQKDVDHMLMFEKVRASSKGKYSMGLSLLSYSLLIIQIIMHVSTLITTQDFLALYALSPMGYCIG
jgi:hypothetical protein